MRWYILGGEDGYTPIPASIEQWAAWASKGGDDIKRVARTQIGDVTVSTVFLGLDHSLGYGPAVLFETMIFGGKNDDFTDRCSTWRQAEKMHEDACAKVRGTNG